MRSTVLQILRKSVLSHEKLPNSWSNKEQNFISVMPTERDIESLESWQVARIIIHFIVFFLSNASIYNGAEILSNSILIVTACTGSFTREIVGRRTDL